jgi:hypothetical protein
MVTNLGIVVVLARRLDVVEPRGSAGGISCFDKFDLGDSFLINRLNGTLFGLGRGT